MAKEKKQDKKEHTPVKKLIEGVKGIVRIGEFDVDGQKKVRNSITGIKGVGKSLAHAVIAVSGINPEELIGRLDDASVKKLEEIIEDPVKFGIPVYMINRRNDPRTGENKHITTSNLIFTRKQDIDHMRKIRCYKGIRHEQGLPVRGQRTRGNFRTGTKMGVIKSKELRAKAKGADK